MENWLIYIGIPIILGIWAQARVTGAFRRYSQVRTSSGLTGAEAAREILDAAQIHDCQDRQDQQTQRQGVRLESWQRHWSPAQLQVLARPQR